VAVEHAGSLNTTLATMRGIEIMSPRAPSVAQACSHQRDATPHLTLLLAERQTSLLIRREPLDELFAVAIERDWAA